MFAHRKRFVKFLQKPLTLSYYRYSLESSIKIQELKKIMKIVTRLVVLFALIACVSFPTFAWDETGHKITAYIAWQQMKPDVREKVIKILTSAPEDSNIGAFYLSYGSRSAESRKREYFMLMATWADIVRDTSFPIRAKNYNRGDWHYNNAFWKFEAGKVVMLDDMPKTGLAMDKIAEFSALIRSDATDAEKAVAIVWLEHLIGDMHQPLHASNKVGSGTPDGDRGGNGFLLTPKGTPRDQQQNLHSYWDGIIGRNFTNDDKCDAEYIDPIARDIMRKFPADNFKDRMLPGNFDAWKAESVKFATTEVYRGIDFFKIPSDDYRKKALGISEERMALAGYRMADLFNEVFGSKMAVVPGTAIACKIIRKVKYPVTQTSSVKQTLEISLLDLCPTQSAARPMYSFMIDGKMIDKEYDVVRTFKTEAEARKFAIENGITDMSF